MRWCVGIEDTAIGVPIRHSGRTLDEYELTEHDRRYREDLDLAASLGVDGIRYGVPWYRVNPSPGVYRWELVDPMIEHAAGRLGLTVIADLVHYGVPAWVTQGFADPAYPAAVEDYAGAFASHYGRLVRHYTPLNEPCVTAAFCGESGGWPPYLTGPAGWTTIAVAVADGIQRSIGSIRSVLPDATIVHVEAAKLLRPVPTHLADAARLSELRAWLPTDLVLGRVDDHHPLAGWLHAHGADPQRLDALCRASATIDVMGVNFYPQFSVREILESDDGIVEVAGGGTGDDLAAVLRAFAQRYGVPVAVTETSYDGDDESRSRWLRQSTEAVRSAAAAGLRIWGYTWWPLFDFVDWGISAGGVPFEDFLVRLEHADGSVAFAPLPSPGLRAGREDGVGPWLRPMGLWRLQDTADGLQRLETSTAGVFRSMVESDRTGS